MTARRLAAVLLAGVLAAAPARAKLPTRSSTVQVSASGAVFVVNPDSNSVARLDFDGAHTGPTVEAPVGTCAGAAPAGACYPRTLALDATHVFTADQNSNTVTRRDQADLGNPKTLALPDCNPYGVAVTPAGDLVVVSCQGTSELVLVDPELGSAARIKLDWPNARAIAVSSNGAKAYVTHYLTEEPDNRAHVSVVDLANRSVAAVFAVAPDTTTCETQNSGQGPLNLVSAIALMPDDAPPAVANQLWIGGEQQNNLSKGLFKREPAFKTAPGAAMFSWLTFAPFPEGGLTRSVYKSSFHDIIRLGIYKLDASDGRVVGKIDIDEASLASDIAFSSDGTTAFVVDQTFNSYHVFNTQKGQGSDVTTIFASPSAFGAGGADPAASCIPEALTSITGEGRFRMAPQAELRVIDGYEPRDTANAVVNTGAEFDAKTYWTTSTPTAPGTSQMIAVPDGIGTAPLGVALSPDGRTAYVANYLSRNVVAVGTPQPLDAGGKPANFRCLKNDDFSRTCASDNDCPATSGFCNHPGGAACAKDADCGANGPCIRGADCVPLILAQPLSSITPGTEPLSAAILDGKILFNTVARDASVPNRIGLGAAAPRFNDPAASANLDGGTGRPIPGSVVSTSHDASYVSCSTCHADFGGQDGRTWDFSQFGASLRNTMDLRGRPGFSPGTCSNDSTKECFFDAACGDANLCRANPAMIPANVAPADRDRWFNPMLTVHWNGDRDEVEDFEHTYRSLLGASDCDGNEDTDACLGALIQKSPETSSDPADVNPDLGAPNRNIRGPSTQKIVGFRLTHMADFVYSLTDFVRNPNPPSEAAERGRKIFNDPQTNCTACHLGGPGAGRQFFTDKKPNASFDPSQPGAADRNNPFVRHDVGTMNLFDAQNPLDIAKKEQAYQNAKVPVPGNRGPLGDYVTPVLNDLWNTAPYLHDGSAHTLLDVVRPCDTTVDDCLKPGRGRNLNGQHGVTAFLTPQQLNDLAAFQKTLTLGTVVGTNERVIAAGALDVSRVVLQLPTASRRARKSRFTIRGLLRGAPGPIDPQRDGVVFAIATPQGEQMAIFFQQLVMKGRHRRLVGQWRAGRAALTVALTRVGGGYRVSAKGKRCDLTALAPDAGDPKSRDLTVSLEIGGTSFVRNQNLVGKRNVFRLARRRR